MEAEKQTKSDVQKDLDSADRDRCEEGGSTSFQKVGCDSGENVGGTSTEDAKAQRLAAENLLTDAEKKELMEESMLLKDQGNSQFASGNFDEAIEIYSKALDKCPLEFTSNRAVYLSNRAASYMKLSNWDSAVKDCTEALSLGAPNDKPLERRAYSYAMVEENLEKALEDYQSLSCKYPEKKMYRERIEELKKEIEQRNERTKAKMIEELKKLGNMCLRPFGLSTDNFQLQQQPEGGYTIQFKQ